MSSAFASTSGHWNAWSLDPIAAAGSLLALLFFLLGWRRLRARRVSLAPWSRVWLFCCGLLLVLLGIISPLDAIAEGYLQSAHMLQHVLIADAGVALMLVGCRGPLTFFFVPKSVLVPLARMGWLRKALAWVLRPRVALPLWVIVVLAWHVPTLYERALHQPLVHRFEHVSFVVVGLLVWVLIVDPGRHGRLTRGERIGVVALLFWVGQILSYVMVFAPTPFYDTYVHAPERLLGLSALTDQKLAGVVMMAEQALVLGIAFALLLRRPDVDLAPSELHGTYTP